MHTISIYYRHSHTVDKLFSHQFVHVNFDPEKWIGQLYRNCPDNRDHCRAICSQDTLPGDHLLDDQFHTALYGLALRLVSNHSTGTPACANWVAALPEKSRTHHAIVEPLEIGPVVRDNWSTAVPVTVSLGHLVVCIRHTKLFVSDVVPNLFALLLREMGNVYNSQLAISSSSSHSRPKSTDGVPIRNVEIWTRKLDRGHATKFVCKLVEEQNGNVVDFKTRIVVRVANDSANIKIHPLFSVHVVVYCGSSNQKVLLCHHLLTSVFTHLFKSNQTNQTRHDVPYTVLSTVPLLSSQHVCRYDVMYQCMPTHKQCAAVKTKRKLLISTSVPPQVE